MFDNLKSRFRRRLSGSNRGVLAVYIAMIGFFVANFMSYYHAEAGFAWLPRFGGNFDERRTWELKRSDYLVTSQYGYDGQFYAQLALHPGLKEEGIQNSVDNFPYRARRILFSWTAYILGMGQTEWVLQAYSFQNFLFWLMLAVLLLHWFPPTDWQNAIRYIGVLFTPGLISSVTQALLDGPALFFVALSAYLIEKNRVWMGCAGLALSGLGKDVNILSGVLAPYPENGRIQNWLSYGLKAILVGFPLLIWVWYVNGLAGGTAGVAGSGNFDWPFVSWFKLLKSNVGQLFAIGWTGWSVTQFWVLMSLILTGLYFVVRPKLKSMWWRLGIVYAVLMFVLGDAVWEGEIGATARVVLPLFLAFNILLPKTRRAFSILIFANSISVFGFVDLHDSRKPQLFARFVKTEPSTMNVSPGGYLTENLEFDDQWYGIEWRGRDYWRWSPGDGVVRYRIHEDREFEGVFSFKLRSDGERTVHVWLNEELLESISLQAKELSKDIEVAVRMGPGDHEIRFTSDEAANRIEVGDPSQVHHLKFSVYNYFLVLEPLPKD